MDEIAYNEHLIIEIGSIITEARDNVIKTVNNELITAYRNIGRVIVEDELKIVMENMGNNKCLNFQKY